MKPRTQHKRRHTTQLKNTHSYNSNSPENDPESLFVLDMLVGNDWRHLVLSHKTAQKLIQHTQHRGYTLEPYDNR
ncbi:MULTISPECIES: hypothetical protein [Vibrio]|uniref:Uncharacterized protein n=1 Tax=Vibrio harveyi TaxID=669 RepID=A0A8B3DGK5_VIBHA|nr:MULTISPECIES: hypothetical protein [Vibrio]EKO3838871.1 hypothetical protein [Vibrio harveyi]ELH7813223.1 hypothetical protein [Vibrio harveyi]ELI6429828.1 hypothetical protein [Vibrio harveyi]KNY41953.1 hypothetical protein AKG94_17870 [Vibrio harveyi]RCR62465.1 hypothetical protein DTW68_15330 [Vibrio harveyi]